MISDMTGINYIFLEGEDFSAPEAGKELLNSIENSVSDIFGMALTLPENNTNKQGRAFICVDSITRNVDAWTEVDDDIASAILMIYQQDSNEYLLEGMLAKLSIFPSASETEYMEFEIYKDKISRFNKFASLPDPKAAEQDFSEVLLKALHKHEEQKSRENEARPMNIEMGMDFTSSFSSEQIFKLTSFLRDEIFSTLNTAS